MNRFQFQFSAENQRSKAGFTLLELIMAITVFTIFISILMTSFVFLMRAQRDANEMRRIYSEARFLMDELAEEIRLKTVDYDCYESVLVGPGPLVGDCTEDWDLEVHKGKVGTLALVDPFLEKRTRFRVQDGNLQISRQVLDATGNWQADKGYELEEFQSLTAERITVKNLEFLITPFQDPLAFENRDAENYQYQPRVTVWLSLNGRSQLRVDGVNFDIQTTFSSRVYGK